MEDPTPIFITSQMLEQARIYKRELRVLFADFKHAFDAVDKVVGLVQVARQQQP